MADEPVITDPNPTTPPTSDTPPSANEPNDAPATPSADAPPEGDTPPADPKPDDADDGTALGGSGKKDGDDAPQGAPEEYALSLKDDEGNDVTLDADSIAEASAVFKELNLTNDQANSLMPVANKFMQRTQEATLKQIGEAGQAQKADWLKEAKADETLGGANWDGTLELAAKGMDALGFVEGHEFRSLLNETGLGNNIHVIKAFKTLGEVVSEEGTFARDNASGEPETVGWSDLYKDQ